MSWVATMRNDQWNNGGEVENGKEPHNNNHGCGFMGEKIWIEIRGGEERERERERGLWGGWGKKEKKEKKRKWEKEIKGKAGEWGVGLVAWIQLEKWVRNKIKKKGLKSLTQRI